MYQEDIFSMSKCCTLESEKALFVPAPVASGSPLHFEGHCDQICCVRRALKITVYVLHELREEWHEDPVC